MFVRKIIVCAAFALMTAISSVGISAAASVAPRTTNLLFPFATNTAGFDTGLSIANTTATPFETLHQSGKCDIFFYGSGAPSSPFPTPTIPAGTVYTNLISNIAPNFQGYLIVTCTFGGASGMGFVSDVGARNLFSAYIAPILPTPAQ